METYNSLLLRCKITKNPPLPIKTASSFTLNILFLDENCSEAIRIRLQNYRFLFWPFKVTLCFSENLHPTGSIYDENLSCYTETAFGAAKYVSLPRSHQTVGKSKELKYIQIMAAMVYDSDLRTLNESELVYKISNRKDVNFNDESTFEDFVQQLTPGRKETALAVVELYTRMKAKKDNANRILSSFDIYTLMHPVMANLEIEESWAIFMNMASRVIKTQRISKGGLSSTAVDVRVILKEALLCNAVSIALVHNHPSGAIRPSREDDRLTKSLADACNILNIRLVDHVIVTDGHFYSYDDEGRL